MGLFGRRRPRHDTPADRIVGFWQWWEASGRTQAEQSIAGLLAPEAFAANMTKSLESVGDLAWELGQGDLTEHRLVISPEGQAPKRALARRVLLAAPSSDGVWEYADSRPPVLDPDGVELGVPGHPPVRFADLVISARQVGSVFDVAVHHPAYSQMSDEARAMVTMLALDAALGEVGSQLWIGQITASEVPPVDGFALSGLRAVVEAHASALVDPDGQPRWVVLEGQSPQGPVLAMAQRPLHPASAPTFETHVSVLLPYAYRTESGLPAAESLESLRAVEARLNQVLGAHGQVVAHQSSAGTREIHIFIDPSQPGIMDQIRQLARAWGEGNAAVIDTPDPGWESVAHLRR